MDKSKKLIIRLCLGLTLFSTACNSNPTTTEADAPTHSPTPATGETAPPNALIDARADSVVTLTIPAGDSSLVMLGELKSLNQHIAVSVPVQDKRRLTASLIPLDSLNNIRFAQLLYPDGKKEGPFGKDISVATPQNGHYQLIITHNLMAEGGLAKEFKLRVTLGSKN